MLPNGLPMRAEDAAPVERRSSESPVTRSLAVLAPPAAPGATMAPFEPPQLLLPRTASPLPGVGAARAAQPRDTGLLPPLLTETFVPLSRTHLRTSLCAGAAMRRLEHVLDDLSLAHAYQPDVPFTLLARDVGCSFVAALMRDGDDVVVEFRRHTGCPMIFHAVFTRARLLWADAALDGGGAPAAPAAPASPLLLAPPPLVMEDHGSAPAPAPLSPAESEEGWACLRRWMQTDPAEALRSLALLAPQSRQVPRGVLADAVALMVSGPAELAAEAMHALAAVAAAGAEEEGAGAAAWEGLLHPAASRAAALAASRDAVLQRHALALLEALARRRGGAGVLLAAEAALPQRLEAAAKTAPLRATRSSAAAVLRSVEAEA